MSTGQSSVTAHRTHRRRAATRPPRPSGHARWRGEARAPTCRNRPSGGHCSPQSPRPSSPCAESRADSVRPPPRRFRETRGGRRREEARGARRSDTSGRSEFHDTDRPCRAERRSPADGTARHTGPTELGINGSLVKLQGRAARSSARSCRTLSRSPRDALLAREACDHVLAQPPCIQHRDVPVRAMSSAKRPAGPRGDPRCTKPTTSRTARASRLHRQVLVLAPSPRSCQTLSRSPHDGPLAREAFDRVLARPRRKSSTETSRLGRCAPRSVRQVRGEIASRERRGQTRRSFICTSLDQCWSNARTHVSR